MKKITKSTIALFLSISLLIPNITSSVIAAEIEIDPNNLIVSENEIENQSLENETNNQSLDPPHVHIDVNEDMICDECGNDLNDIEENILSDPENNSPNCEHEYIYEYVNENTHKKICKKCNISEIENCVYEENICNACGHKEDPIENEIKETILSKTIGSRTISVSGNLPEGIELEVEEITNKGQVDFIEHIINETDSTFNTKALYDIKLILGSEEWQPIDHGEEVVVTITNINGANGKTYRIADDGTVTNMNAIVVNDTVSFETDHFTNYAIGGIEYDENEYKYFSEYEGHILAEDNSGNIITTTTNECTLGENVSASEVTTDLGLNVALWSDGVCIINGTQTEDSYYEGNIWTRSIDYETIYMDYNANGYSQDRMFSSLYYGDYAFVNQNKVKHIKKIYTGPNLDTSNVKIFERMFMGNTVLTDIDLTYMDTSSAEKMAYMFEGCSSLTSINVSNFNTTKVKDMPSMFLYCESLTEIDISNFVINANSLKGRDGDENNILYAYPFYTEDGILYTFTRDCSLTEEEAYEIMAECGSIDACLRYILDNGYPEDVKEQIKEMYGDNAYNMLKQNFYAYWGTPNTKIHIIKTPKKIDNTILLDYICPYHKLENGKLTGSYLQISSGDENLTLVNDNHIDENNDNICDVCNVEIPLEDLLCEYENVQYGKTKTNNPNITLSAHVTHLGLDVYIYSDGFCYVGGTQTENSNNDTLQQSPWYNNSAIETIYDNHTVADTVESASGLYCGTKIKKYITGDDFDISNIKYANAMFGNSKLLTSIDLNNFDTSNFEETSSMFANCSRLSSINVSNFNTSKIKCMSMMFSGCSSLTELDLSNFDTSNVTDMTGMFSRCSALGSLNLTNFNTQKVTNMREMFDNCNFLTFLYIFNFDTSNVKDMSSMFNNCTKLNSLNLNNFDTSSVTNMQSMFNNCDKLEKLSLKGFDTSNVTNMTTMFAYCDSLTILDIRNFNVNKVTNMNYMFGGCPNLETIISNDFVLQNEMNDIFGETPKLVGAITFTPENNSSKYANTTSGYFTKPVSNFLCTYEGKDYYDNEANATETFYGLTTYVFDDGFCYIDGTQRNYIFEEYRKPWHTFGNIKIIYANYNPNSYNQSCMFQNCEMEKFVTGDNFDTSNTQYMSRMFYNCQNLKFVDLSKFDTSTVTLMTEMFADCPQLTSLDLSSFNVEKVQDMSGMFSGCVSLTSLDLNSFNTIKVNDTSQMFLNCSSLTELNLENFNMNYVTNASKMFKNCSKLESLKTSTEVLSVSEQDYIRFYETIGANYDDYKGLTKDEACTKFYNDAGLSEYMEYDEFCEAWDGLWNESFIIDGQKKWGAKYTQDISDMFDNCSSLKYVDLSGFDVYTNSSTYDQSENVVNVNILNNCSSLKKIDTPKSIHSNIEIPLPDTFYSVDDIELTTPYTKITSKNVNKTLKLKCEAGEVVKENIVPATCVESGSYDEVVYCKDCGNEMTRTQKTTGPIGHNVIEYKYNNDATYDEDGTKTGTCIVCGTKITIPDPGSKLQKQPEVNNPKPGLIIVPPIAPNKPAPDPTPSKPADEKVKEDTSSKDSDQEKEHNNNSESGFETTKPSNSTESGSKPTDSKEPREDNADKSGATSEVTGTAGGSYTPPIGDNVISGIITDEDGNGIAKVEVDLMDEDANQTVIQTTTTNSKGYYEFKNVGPGTLSVNAVTEDGEIISHEIVVIKEMDTPTGSLYQAAPMVLTQDDIERTNGVVTASIIQNVTSSKYWVYVIIGLAAVVVIVVITKKYRSQKER